MWYENIYIYMYTNKTLVVIHNVISLDYYQGNYEDKVSKLGVGVYH